MHGHTTKDFGNGLLLCTVVTYVGATGSTVARESSLNDATLCICDRCRRRESHAGSGCVSYLSCRAFGFA
jgi:hypothetical protein